MRNLKRVLSLALASIMLIGMMVIGAGAADITAADLTDIDQVTNKEAVNLMVDLGIIEGKPDGSFAPTDGVDRATMAKLITYILMGDVDASIFEGTTTNLTDIDTNWAEGYIKYCYANGIISGDGQGHFFPTQGVTVVQAAKMLLVALGYEADASGYQGSSLWSVNIMKDAQTAGLLDGVDGTATDTLTRDGAAQMIFNALFANTVTPEFQYDMGVQYLSKYVDDGTTLGYQTYGLIEVTATVTGISSGTATLSNVVPSAAASLVNEKLAGTPDMIGTSVVAYVKGTLNADGTVKSVSSLYSTSLSAGDTDVLGTSTNGATIANLTTKTNANYISAIDEDATYFVNGVVAVFGAGDDEYDDTADLSSKEIVRGSVVEFIDTDADGDADIVKITKKTVDEVTGDVRTRTSDDVLQVLVPGVITSWTDADEVSGYEGLADGDMVLKVEIGGVTYLEKCDTVEGVVTSKNSTGSVTVDGSNYYPSGLSGKTYSNYDDVDYVNTWIFYLDNGANIVAAEQVTAEDSDNYAVILETAWVSTGGVSATSYAEALLLHTDGTSEIVTLDELDGNTIVANTATPGDDETKLETVAVGAFYTYSANSDGIYDLESVTDTATVSGTITSGVAKFSEGTALGNSNTVFLVNNDGTYTVYTGISNLPSSITLTSGTAVQKTGGIASYVYMNVSDVSDSSDLNLVYVTSTSYSTRYDSSTKTTYYVYDVIIDGEETTIEAARNDIFSATGLYDCKLDDGVVVKTGTSLVDTATNISTASGGVLVLAEKLNGEDTFIYGSDVVVYIFEDDAVTVGDASDLAATDTDAYTEEVAVVLVSNTTNNQVSAVYIIRADV